jgi:hypothetical protein
MSLAGLTMTGNGRMVAAMVPGQTTRGRVKREYGVV